MRLLLVLMIVSILSCENYNSNPSDADSAIVKNDKSAVAKDTTNSSLANKTELEASEKNDSTIVISFPKDSTWVTVSGKMKGINNPVTIIIPVKQGKRLTATILPEDATANIRINQIFTPSGKADGPFGRELKRTLSEHGTYKIILSENMMRGEEWKGNFKLTIRVE